MNQLQATQGNSRFIYLHKYSDYSRPTVFIPINGQKSITIKSDLFFIFSWQKCCLHCKDKIKKTKIEVAEVKGV